MFEARGIGDQPLVGRERKVGALVDEKAALAFGDLHPVAIDRDIDGKTAQHDLSGARAPPRFAS